MQQQQQQRRRSSFSPFSPFSPVSPKTGFHHDGDDGVALQASAASPRLGANFASNRGRKSEAAGLASPKPSSLRWTSGKKEEQLRRSSAVTRFQTALDPRNVAWTPARLAGLVFLIFVAGYTAARASSYGSSSQNSLHKNGNYGRVAAHYQPLPSRVTTPERRIADDFAQPPPVHLAPGWQKDADEAGAARPLRRQGPARLRPLGDDEVGEEKFAQADPRQQVIGHAADDDDPGSVRRDSHASKARDKQFQRLRKVAAAKAQNARVAEARPAEMEARQAAMRNEQDPVITEAGVGKQRKLRRPPSGTLEEFAQEVAAERRLAENRGSGHAVKHERGAKRRLPWRDDDERELEEEIDTH